MNNPFQQSLQRVLSAKVFGWITIVVAIGVRGIQLLYFFNIRSDASFQFLATQNLVKGHGLSIGRVNASDLASVDYVHLVQWPPGFSILAAPFYVLFNNNYIIAGFVLQL